MGERKRTASSGGSPRLHVSILVGNPKPRSRTLSIAEGIARRLFDPRLHHVQVIDLSQQQPERFAPVGEDAAGQLMRSDVVLVASPTYRAAPTGLLKTFLDSLPEQGLAGVVAIPLMTAAGERHTLAIDLLSGPLLELGAVVVGRGIYFMVDDGPSTEDRLDAAAVGYARQLDTVARLAAHRLGTDNAI